MILMVECCVAVQVHTAQRSLHARSNTKDRRRRRRGARKTQPVPSNLMHQIKPWFSSWHPRVPQREPCDDFRKMRDVRQFLWPVAVIASGYTFGALLISTTGKVVLTHNA